MFDWRGMLDQLTTAKALWQEQQVSRYVYQYSSDCFCEKCWTAPKFVFIENNVVEHVEFDESEIADWDNECSECDLAFPLMSNYHPIDWFYDEAIEFATNGIDADCTSNIPPDVPDAVALGDIADSMYCGASMSFTYDETLYYPIEISMNYPESFVDAGLSHRFGCIEIYGMEEDGYHGRCTNYAGCTEAPCGDDFWPCKDVNPVCCKGNDFSNPCDAKCDGFHVEKECKMGECPKHCMCTMEYDPVCCNGDEFGNQCNAECQGFDLDEDCIAGPCDECTCPEKYKPVCCGKKHRKKQYDNKCFAECNDHDHHCTRGECKKPIPKPCMCRMMYDPVCCNGKEFANLCEAGCRGYDGDDECRKGPCNLLPPPVHPTPKPKPPQPPIPPQFDWKGMLDQLTTARDKWQHQQVSRYVYQFHPVCFCMPCWTAPKFVFIENNVAEHVEYDQAESPKWNNECNDCDLSYPLSDGYHPIDWFYDKAIDFATNGMNADCGRLIDDENDEHQISRPMYHGPMHCGGSMRFTYDETLYYPKSISMSYGPMIADGNVHYEFGCLQIYDMEGHHGIYGNTGSIGQCPNYRGCTEAAQCHDDWTADNPVCCKGRQFKNPRDAQCDGWNVETSCELEECRKPCMCTKEYMPVCCNGNDFGNSCLAKCHAFEVSQDCRRGKCDDCVCPEIYDPVCCNGEDYDNECVAGCYNDNIGNGICTPGKCSDAPPPCLCTMQYDPVCCNGKEYGNQCAAGCNGIQNDQCERGNCAPSCSLCEKTYDPQCCDLREFDNRCFAECQGQDKSLCLSNYRQESCGASCPLDVGDTLCCKGVEFKNKCFAQCQVCDYLNDCKQGSCPVVPPEEDDESTTSRISRNLRRALWWTAFGVGCLGLSLLLAFSWRKWLLRGRLQRLASVSERRQIDRIDDQPPQREGFVGSQVTDLVDDTDFAEYNTM